MRTLRPSVASGETIADGWITPEMSAYLAGNDEVFYPRISGLALKPRKAAKGKRRQRRLGANQQA